MTQDSHQSNVATPAKGAQRASRRPLGYQITLTYCRACVPEGVQDSYAPMREGDDYGVAYRCDQCDAELAPCDHQWSEWTEAFGGGQIRFCKQDNCCEADRRDG